MPDGFDVLVIGSGAAGSTCARRLVRAGVSVALAEAGRWGGTCLWTGCMPKKSLYHSARAVDEVRKSDEFGAGCSDTEPDWTTALAWKWHSQETYAGDQHAILSDQGIQLIEGSAVFVAPRTVRIAETTYTPEHVVIATGSRPVVPQVDGRELLDTSDDALHYAEIPERLLILGAGFIAFELAGIFAAFGSEVTLATHGDRYLSPLAPELSEVATARMRTMGVHFSPRTELLGLSGERGAISATLRGPDGAVTSMFSRVIAAIGRRPDMSQLGLEAAGVDTNSDGSLKLDESLRTTDAHVWAAGDAAGGLMHTPVARLQGATVASSIATGTPQVPDLSTMATTCFAVPQLASVGVSLERSQELGLATHANHFSFDTLAAAIIEDERDGFVRLVVEDATGRILGAQMAGPTACDCIAIPAAAMAAGMTAEQFGKVVGVHPSFGEAWSYVAY
jgi:pyruvate/2-oxoglutarate dehydrogenase complex dihydrolipoamide dehydrogenase (E3) component